MDYGNELKKTIVLQTLLAVLLVGSSSVLVYAVLSRLEIAQLVMALVTLLWVCITATVAAFVITKIALRPFTFVKQAIMHVSSSTSHMPAPDIDTLRTGRELITSLILTVYDMASSTHTSQPTYEQAQQAVVVSGENLLNDTPLPLFTLAVDDSVHFVNDAALGFLGLDVTARAGLIGKNINDVLSMSFPNELTLESWLRDCREKVLKAGTTWERVRLVDPHGTPLKQFDLAASYSKAGGDVESVIVLFDRTDTYATDDQEISFVAMAVHELRTPLTIMRGYIEVFEDELGPTLEPEMKDFMHKMNASAQQLTAFVSNILNVARVEENQLVLSLTKQDLGVLLKGAVADLELRAQVHKKHIELELPVDLPAVAVDRISLHEVINNLVDNAIKYSGNSEKIVVSVKNLDEYVQVNVQDFGVGMPDSVVPKLFDKFYRSHRSKVQVGGTGLGLYLCKAIVVAHGGNIWVRTKEGEGSTFSFTLEKYNEAKHGAEAQGQDGIMRGAHGWIKNHSMYRQ
jgi:signal transduction histidine kinase